MHCFRLRHRSMGMLHDSNRHEVIKEKGLEPQLKVAQSSNDNSHNFIAIEASGSRIGSMPQNRESTQCGSGEMPESSTNARTSRRRSRHVKTIAKSQVNSQSMVEMAQKPTELTENASHEKERPYSMAYMDRYAPKDERFYRSREELRRERIEREKATGEDTGRSRDRSCSLRRSMRSLFRGSEKKSSDMWVDGRPRSPGPLMVDVSHRRSKSLPRSLKSVKNSVSKFVKSRSSSTEGRLDDPKADFQSQDLTEPTDFVTHVVKPKPRGFLRSMTMRLSRSQSNVNATRVEQSAKNVAKISQAKSVANLGHQATLQGGAGGVIPYHYQQGTPQGGGNMRVVAGSNVSPGYHQTPTPTNKMNVQATYHSPDAVYTPVKEPQNTMYPRASPHCSPNNYANVSPKHRINVPPGNAWKAFGEVTYRQPPKNTQKEYRSSSGHWSATESTRFSSSSAASTQPDTASFASHDRDSAISCQHNKPYGGRVIERKTSLALSTISSTDCGDGSTRTGGGEALSTSSSLRQLPTAGDSDKSGSTLNGSVIQLVDETNLSKNNLADSGTVSEWGGDTHTEKRKKRRSRKPKEFSVDGINSEENMLNKLTENHMKAHNQGLMRNVSSGKADDETSLWSVDQDGFYTSMHTESHLMGFQSAERKPPPPPPRLSSTGLNLAPCVQDNTVSSKNNMAGRKLYSQSQTSLLSLNDRLDKLELNGSTFSLASVKSTDSKCSKHGAASVTVKANTRRNGEAKTEAKTGVKSKTPPSKCKMAANQSEVNECEQLGTKLPSAKSISSKSKSTSKSSETPGLTATETELSEKEQKASLPVSHKLLTSLTGKAPNNPLLKTIQAADCGFSRDVRQRSFRMIVNALLESSYEKSDKSMDDSVISVEFDLAGMELIDTSVYSTWPRRPNIAHAANEQQQNPGSGINQEQPVTDTKSTVSENNNVSPESVSLMNSQTADNPKHTTPQKKTQKSQAEGHKVPSRKSSLEQTKQKTPKSNTEEEQTNSSVPDVSVLNHTGEMTGTWPKKKNKKVKEQENEQKQEEETPETPQRGFIDPDDKLSWTNSFPRKKTTARVRSRTAEPPSTLPFQHSLTQFSPGHIHAIDVSHIPANAAPLQACDTLIRSPNPFDIGSPPAFALDNTAISPPPLQPAQARLIISSPVSSQSMGVASRHQRALCSPVSERDFEIFSFQCTPTGLYSESGLEQKGKVDVDDSAYVTVRKTFAPSFSVVKSNTMFEFGTKNDNTPTEEGVFKPKPTTKPISEPLYASISDMKHSLKFPVPWETSTKRINNNRNSRTWYDDTSADPDETKSTKQIHIYEQCLPKTGYPFMEFLDETYACQLQTSCDKRWSGISVTSVESSASSETMLRSQDKTRSKISLTSEKSAGKMTDAISIGSAQTFDSFASQTKTQEKTSKVSLTSEQSAGKMYDTISVSSTQTYDSIASQTSGTSLLETYQQRRPTGDQKSLSLNLREKINMTKGTGTSVTTLPPPPPLPTLPPPVEKKKPVEAISEKGKKRPSSPEKPAKPILSLQLLSPPKLKRSSAVLEGDFDIFGSELPSPSASESDKSFSTSFSSTTAKTDHLMTLFGLNSKRQCISPTPTSSQGASPAKSVVVRRSRLRRTVSRGKMNRSRGSIYESTESILRSPLVKADSLFTIHRSVNNSLDNSGDQFESINVSIRKELLGTEKEDSITSSPEPVGKPGIKLNEKLSGEVPVKTSKKSNNEKHSVILERSDSTTKNDAKRKNDSSKRSVSITSRLPQPFRLRGNRSASPPKKVDEKRETSDNLPKDKKENKTKKSKDKNKKEPFVDPHLEKEKSIKGAKKSNKTKSTPEKVEPSKGTADTVSSARNVNHYDGTRKAPEQQFGLKQQLYDVVKTSTSEVKSSKTSPKKSKSRLDGKTQDQDSSVRKPVIENIEQPGIGPTPKKQAPVQYSLSWLNQWHATKKSSRLNRDSVSSNEISNETTDTRGADNPYRQLSNEPETMDISTKKTSRRAKSESRCKSRRSTSCSVADISQFAKELNGGSEFNFPQNTLSLKSASTFDLASRELGEKKPVESEANRARTLRRIKQKKRNSKLLTSNTDMTRSLSNLSCLSLMQSTSEIIYDSELSLAISTENLSSRADKNRAARQAFLASPSVSESRKPSERYVVDERFSKYEIGGRESSTINATTSTGTRMVFEKVSPSSEQSRIKLNTHRRSIESSV